MARPRGKGRVGIYHAYVPVGFDEYRCDNCDNPFLGRKSDRKRGWARYCSKSCKAQHHANLRWNNVRKWH